MDKLERESLTKYNNAIRQENANLKARIAELEAKLAQFKLDSYIIRDPLEKVGNNLKEQKNLDSI